MMSSLLNWFRPRRGTIVNRAGARKNSTCKLRVETLEDRTVPAAPSGVVSWWTGDNTAVDVMGVNNGALFNGANYAAGKVGNGFNFDGVDDYFKAGTTGMPIGNAARTMELWVKLDTLPTTGEAFFAGYGNTGVAGQSYGLGANSSGVFWSQWGSGIGGPVLAANQWYHVAVTNVGDTATLYLNGVAVGTNTVPIDTPARTTLYAGRNPGTVGDTRRLDGMVDDIAVYNRALSAAEIQGIYNAGAAGKASANYFYINNASVTEGAAGETSLATFTINRVGSGQASVNWSTANGTATVADSDYVAASGQLVFAVGESQKTVTISVNGDSTAEPDETFSLMLSTTTPGYAIAGSGQATIVNDDVGISIDDGSAIEGSTSLHSLGTFIDAGYAGLAGPYSIALRNGDMFVSSWDHDNVLRFDAATGEYKSEFISPGNGGLVDPKEIVFDSAGNLYVSSTAPGSVFTNCVICYDATGALVGTGPFVAPGGTGGELETVGGITIGPNGDLYVVSRSNPNGAHDKILRYQGANGPNPGAFIGVYATEDFAFTAASAGLVFGPDGKLYVAAYNRIFRAEPNGDPNTPILNWTPFVPEGSGGLDGPRGLLFDSQGNLVVTNTSPTPILRYQGPGGANPGALIDGISVAASGGLNQTRGIALGADGYLYVASRGSNQVLRYGSAAVAALTVRLSVPSAVPVTVDYTTVPGSAGAADFIATSGTLTFAPGQTTRTVFVQTVSDAVPESTETFAVNLSNATGGAAITDFQGVATITEIPSISISDVTMVEGKKGNTTVFTFTITLSQPSADSVTVSYQTVDGTATTANKDYVAKTGTITFLPGETTKTITIVVTGDNTKEANELFYVDLFGNSVNSMFTKNRGIGTIVNDD